MGTQLPKPVWRSLCRSRPQADTLRPCWNQIRSARLRRYTGTEPGGPCQGSRGSNCKAQMGNDCVIAGCDGVRTGEGGVTRTAVDGKVVPFCAQLSAHKSSASVILVVSFCRSAALQQSISIIPPMLHSFSPKCSGTPANALPASTSKRNKDANRFISIGTLVKSANQSQPFQVLRACGGSDTGIRKSLGNGRAVVLVVLFSPASGPKVRNFTRPSSKIRKCEEQRRLSPRPAAANGGCTASAFWNESQESQA